MPARQQQHQKPKQLNSSEGRTHFTAFLKYQQKSFKTMLEHSVIHKTNPQITNRWTLSLPLCLPAWNSLESLTDISPLLVNNRSATRTPAFVSAAESLGQVSDVDIYWLSACVCLLLGPYCDNTGLCFCMHLQTDLGQREGETAGVRSAWLFRPGGVNVYCVSSAQTTDKWQLKSVM